MPVRNRAGFHPPKYVTETFFSSCVYVTVLLKPVYHLVVESIWWTCFMQVPRKLCSGSVLSAPLDCTYLHCVHDRTTQTDAIHTGPT